MDHVFHVGGGNVTSPVVWYVDSVGYANRGGDNGALYLTVDVWPTHFENKGLQFAIVMINGIIVDPYCTPDEECGLDFYTCFYDMDVQSYIREAQGGSLKVEVISTGTSSVCDHMGYPLFVRMFLRDSLPTNQPTSMPSIVPSSLPSLQPSSQPTRSPTGQPSCQPSHQPTGSPAGAPTIHPSHSPSGHPSFSPSSQPSTVPSYPPSGRPSQSPTALPFSMPTGLPSHSPSGGPSFIPTTQPSSHPTRIRPQSLTYSAGGDDNNPVVWNVDGLGYVDNGYPLYLSVDVFPTNYENRANQYATVRVNGVIVQAYCTPDESCGTDWYSCVSELDVSSYREEEQGGSLSVEVTSTGLNYGICDESSSGKPLFVRLSLWDALPTGIPTDTPSGFPTIQPSGLPSAVPSTNPTIIPTAIPTERPTGRPSSEPSGHPTNVPSPWPSAMPSVGPSCDPSAHPTAQPASGPSALPSSCPSSLPSTQPSSVPSTQPSSHPTRIRPQSLTYSAGGDDDNPVVWNVDGLGYVDNGYPLYLSVDVFPTNYENRANQYATVRVNGVIVQAYCTPDESCGTDWYSCVSELDVSSYREEEQGGSLSVEVTSTGLNYGICDESSSGKPLFVRLSLWDALPTGIPTDTPSGFPTIQPSGLPSAAPSTNPTIVPTAIPTERPTGRPTSCPSEEPTTQPSSHPTRVRPQSLTYSAGGDDDNPVVWNVDGLGYVDNGYPLYLSVDVFPTNYENRANQYATVRVNGVIVQAYCTPDESCGTEWYSCVSELDVSSYREEEQGGSLSVEVTSTGLNYGICDESSSGKPLFVRLSLWDALPTGIPTDTPSGFPTIQPSGLPSAAPSTNPTIVPTAIPTERPTGRPTSCPSEEPTTQPSSHPTRIRPQSLTYSAGGDDNNPVVWNVDGLGYVDNGYPLFLSVDVFPTNYENRANQYATVRVNGVIVQAYCTPDESCGTDWYSCVSELDVSSYREEEQGGSLSVAVSSSNVKSGACDFETFPLYSRMYLRNSLPTGEPTGQPSVVPSAQPAAEPSGAPTGNPSNKPSADPSAPPSFKPSTSPTAVPSNFPTKIPTYAQTTSFPSYSPSCQPSSNPTLITPFSRLYYAGGNETSPVLFHLSNLGFASRHMRNESVYLSVDVFPTDYAIIGNQWATVKLNGVVIDAYCTPDESCGNDWYSCVTGLDISDEVSPENGGSVVVEVASFGVLTSPCDYRGYPLYAKVSLTETPAGDIDTISVYYFLYAVAGLFVISLIILLVHIFIKKEKNIISVYFENREAARKATVSSGKPGTIMATILALTEFSKCLIGFGSASKVSPNLECNDEVEDSEDDEEKALQKEVEDRIPLSFADMSLLKLRARKMARVHHVEGEQSMIANNELLDDMSEDSGRGFIETLQSWDELDKVHEKKIAENNKPKTIGKFKQVGRVSTMSWLLNNDIDA